MPSSRESAAVPAFGRSQFDYIRRLESKGAFQPFVQDPIVTALAALFGGTGGMMLLEQLQVLPYR